MYMSCKKTDDIDTKTLEDAMNNKVENKVN